MEWVLLGTIVTIIIVGCWLARSTQDYIDEQNERYRKEDMHMLIEIEHLTHGVGLQMVLMFIFVVKHASLIG
jgi:hypothetical protein